MNRNVMIVLAGGFLIAVLVALLVQASLSGGKKEPVAPSEMPKVQIVVASKDLKIGAELSDENMKWHDWPQNAIFPGAIVKEGDKKPSEAVSGRLLRDVKANEPVVENALVPETKGNFLAASLDEGMKAVAVDVDASGMVGGFVGPGDFVDVILTYKRNIKYDGPENPEIQNMIERNLDSMATETILQNIKVMAVDQSAMRDAEGKVKVAKTVTLAVDYKSAEVLALAQEMGEISLALRRLGDETIVKQKPPVTTDARTTRIFDEVFTEMSKLQESSGQTGKSVRIYRGDRVETIAVAP